MEYAIINGKLCQVSGSYLAHSAKGSSWKKHKYIKKVDGKYFYPKGYGEDGEEYDQKHEYGVVLEEVEKGVYDYMNYKMQSEPGSYDPKNMSADDMKKFIKEYIKFVGGDPNKIPESEYDKLQRNADRHYKSDGAFTKKDIDDLAKEAANGSFGDEKAQKELFGDDYEKIKKRMDEQKAESKKESSKKKEKAPDDGWEKTYYEETKHYLEEGSGYKPAQTLRDFVVELNESGIRTEKYSDSQLEAMYEKVKKKYNIKHSDYDDDDELYHHGTKGMKWGVRLYQNKDGSLTPLGKRRYRTDKDFKKTVDKQNAAAKARAAKAEKARLAEEQKKLEAEKERVLKAGSAEELKKYIGTGQLSNTELQYAVNRLNLEQSIKSTADKEAEAAKGKSKVDKFIDGMDKVTTGVNSAAKMYNTGVNIVNAFSGLTLPKVDTNITSGNADAVKKAKKEKQKEADAQKKREEQEAQRESKRQERDEKKAKAENESKTESKTEPKAEKVKGKVEWYDKSKASKYEEKPQNDDIIEDANWREVGKEQRETGKELVTYLLEDKLKHSEFEKEQNQKGISHSEDIHMNPIIYESNNELYHYGVLGMKWGVRRGNTAKAYAKASKKLQKLDSKLENRQKAARKARSHADNRESSWLASDKSIAKANKKARKAASKAVVAARKGRKWYERMEKTFADTDVSLSQEQRALGKKYLDTLDRYTEIRAFV